MQNEVTINGVSGISVIGAGIDDTILDFSEMAVQGNGIFAIGDDFLINGKSTIVEARSTYDSRTPCIEFMDIELSNVSLE